VTGESGLWDNVADNDKSEKKTKFSVGSAIRAVINDRHDREDGLRLNRKNITTQT